jgi:ADP-ribose pyrophosphatase
MKLVTIDVKLTEEDPEPEAKLDEGEHIVKRVVEVKDLWKTLEGQSISQNKSNHNMFTTYALLPFPDALLEYNEKGFILDARLSHFAYGMHLTQELTS